MHALLAALHSPHLGPFPIIHIAGTKGKGSTATMISSILQHSGYRVGTYTSPHVVSIHERIAINATPITNTDLTTLITTHIPTIDSLALGSVDTNKPTHFEVLTALAFRYFADQHVDVAVIEAGMGGARDATNIVPPHNTACSVITAIDTDHEAALGGSLEAIARAKAGILRPFRPAVFARQPHKAASAVIESRGAELGCDSRQSEIEVKYDNGSHSRATTLHLSPWVARALGGTQSSTDTNYSTGVHNAIENLRLSMPGPHQVDNATTAITTAAVLASPASSFDEDGDLNTPSPPPLPLCFQILPLRLLLLD